MQIAFVYGAGLMAAVGMAASGDITDSFESYQLGQVPGGIWQDASSYIQNPTNIGPTVAVISTADAFGNQTQAVQIDGDGIGSSGGIIGNVERSRVQRFETDLRIDQFGNGSTPNWSAASGFIQETDQSDFNWMPQAFIYTSTNSQSFRLYVQNADGRGGAARDFSLGRHQWILDTWYRLELEVDTDAGVFDIVITDIANGSTLVSTTRTYTDWNSNYGQYDLVSVNDGEYGTNAGTVGNSASIDNFTYVPTPGTAGLLAVSCIMLTKRRR